MKILQIPPRFYPYVGGVENYVYNLCKELVNLGHEVKVICARQPEVQDSNFEGIDVKRLRYITKISNTNITLSLPKEILREDFDVIHTYLPTPWSADWSAIVSLIRSKPLMLTYCNDILGKGINKYIADLYNLTALKILLKVSKKIFIINENYLKTSSFLKSFKDKIVVTTPGVDLDKFRPFEVKKLKEENSIFFLSKLDKFHQYKGLDYLLFSIKILKTKFPIKLYIGGEGELLEHYKKFARENGLEEMVSFLGFLSDNELVKYYNLCDVFVLPSVDSAQEGFGLVALEAMACRKPVIVSDIIGVADDVKTHNTGIVVTPKNVEQLSEALAFLFSNERKREEMGGNAYNLVCDKYSWKQNAAITEKEYSKLIK